jgi:hypothetical protein
MTRIRVSRAGYGWVLYLNLDSTVDAQALQALCVALCSHPEETPLSIVPSDGRAFHGLTSLVCLRIRRPISVPLIVTDRAAEWRLSAEGWEHCGDLLDGLIELGKGHRYLSEDEQGEPVVVVSLNEAP